MAANDFYLTHDMSLDSRLFSRLKLAQPDRDNLFLGFSFGEYSSVTGCHRVFISFTRSFLFHDLRLDDFVFNLTLEVGKKSVFLDWE